MAIDSKQVKIIRKAKNNDPKKQEFNKDDNGPH